MRARFSLFDEVADYHADRRGPKIALKFEGREITYAMFRERKLKVANGLLAAGVKRYDRIAYFGKNSAAFYEILFGAAAIGAVLVPMNWRLAAPEFAAILEDMQPRLMFAGALPRMGPSQTLCYPCPIVALAGVTGYDVWRDQQAAAVPPAAAAPDDVVVQLYTSGTTGKPKGVMLSQRAMLAFRSLPEEAQPAWNRWTDDDVSLIVMPQFHVGGTGFGLQTLCAGATGLIMTEFDVDIILDFIENENLSKLFTVPSAMQMILRHPRARSVDYRRIRAMVYGASPMPLPILREAIDTFKCGFIQQYGMTEMSGTICVLPPDDHRADGSPRMASAGRPLRNVDIRILDQRGVSVSAGEVGEIAIRSPTAMVGYWNKPEETAASFTKDGFFLSGDLGHFDEDGYLYILDRVKDMIVSGGENIYPAEIEAVIRAYPGVADVSVLGVPDEKWGEAVKAVVEPVAAVTLHSAEIMEWARSQLAGYKLPKSIEFRDQLPRNASGKVLRRILRDPYWKGRERQIN